MSIYRSLAIALYVCLVIHAVYQLAANNRSRPLALLLWTTVICLAALAVMAPEGLAALLVSAAVVVVLWHLHPFRRLSRSKHPEAGGPRSLEVLDLPCPSQLEGPRSSRGWTTRLDVGNRPDLVWNVDVLILLEGIELFRWHDRSGQGDRDGVVDLLRSMRWADYDTLQFQTAAGIVTIVNRDAVWTVA